MTSSSPALHDIELRNCTKRGGIYKIPSFETVDFLTERRTVVILSAAKDLGIPRGKTIRCAELE